jgi:hypothetical protein
MVRLLLDGWRAPVAAARADSMRTLEARVTRLESSLSRAVSR